MHKYTSKKMDIFQKIREMDADLGLFKFTGKKMVLTMAVDLSELNIPEGYLLAQKPISVMDLPRPQVAFHSSRFSLFCCSFV